MVADNLQNNKRIAKNSILLFIRMLFSMGVSLYTTRAILDILGVVDFGIYNVVGGVIVFFGFINQTMSTTTSRFITTALGKNDERLLHNVFCMSINFHAAISLLTLLIGETIGLWFVLNKLTIPIERLDAALVLYHASVLSTCISILNVPYNASIIAHEDMGAFAYISIFQVFSKLIIVLLLPLFCYDKLILFSLLTIFISIIIQIIYWQYSFRKYKEAHFELLWDKQTWKEMSGFASWNITGDLAFMCNTQGLNILLNMFFGPIVNAARGVAVQVESVMIQFIGNFQTAINPQITISYASGNINQTKNLIYKASKFCFFLMFIIAVPFFLEIDYILELWLKNVPEHTIAFIRLTILMVSFDCLSKPLHLAINATGKVKGYQIIQSSLFIFLLPISYTLLKYSNILPEFIILLLLILKVIMLILRVFIISSLIGLNKKDYMEKVIIPSLVCFCVSIIFPLMLILNIAPSTFRLILTIIISFACSIITIYFLGLTKNEKNFVVSLLRKLVNKLI